MINITAADIMDTSAALCNDTERAVYTYAVQLPYFNIALRMLEKAYQENNIPVTDETSAVIEVDAGQSEIVFNGGIYPTLPSDLTEVKELWESDRDLEQWVPMRRLLKVPHHDTTPVNQFRWWVLKGNKIKLPIATGDRDIKIEYIRNLFTQVTDENTAIAVIDARSYLEFQTASLCSEFIGENKTRADALAGRAIEALNQSENISIKSTQSISVRRRPFRAAFKQRWR